MTPFETAQARRNARQMAMAAIFAAVLAAGWRYPLIGYFIPACMVLGIGIGMARGRAWCNWYCPRGSFYDAVMGKLRPGRSMHPFFKNMRARVAVLAVLMAMMALNMVRLWPDPRRIGLLFVVLLTATTTIGIILAVLFHPRAWCQLCPVGTLGNLAGRNKNVLKIDSALCIECKKCGTVCPMSISPYSYKRSGVQPMTDADCVKCGMCFAVCPVKALSFS